MESTGEDPYFVSGPLGFSAGYERVHLRMRVSGGGERVGAELFFATDSLPLHTEDQMQVFEVLADGEFNEYVIDMSDVPTWDGVIINIRLDPAPDAGRVIEIDRIWVED